MGYKVGDKVLIKAEVTDVSRGSERPYFVAPDCRSINWVSEDKIILMDKTYSDGLNDAWELAKKIVCHEEQGGMSIPCFSAIFDEYMTVEEVLASLTAEEALAKIEAYEKEMEIKVKDIVKYHDCEGVGVVTYVDSEHACVMWKNGRFGEYQKCYLEKTGETAECLDDLLRQIGE